MGERVFSGIGIVPDIAIGPVYPVAVTAPQVPQRRIEENALAAEVRRFQEAVAAAERELALLKERAARLPEDAAEEAQILLDAHLAMLGKSRLVRGIVARIETDRMNAEQAVASEVAHLAEQFRALDDKYIAARIEDVESAADRLVRHLTGTPWLTLDAVPSGGIVIAQQISPADTVRLDPRRFAGIATVQGGAAGHTAVMARGLGLPAVLGLPPECLDVARPGMEIIIDGLGGKVIFSPTDQTLAEYRDRLLHLRADGDTLGKLARLTAETRDGQAITLLANMEMPRDLAAVQAVGAEGIGLFRTEYMFMNRATLPDEDEQFEAMASVVREMKGKPVTFRILDIGGDKIARSLGPQLALEDNPALGLRAIRLALKKPALLETQFRAMIRAGYFGPVQILLPMVTTAAEVETCRGILRRCYEALKKAGLAVPEKVPPLGVMIEIPAAALSADALAAVADFFAIGTNDLIQYTVAIDRGNDQVADLYDPLNPAVLRLMQFAIEAAKRAGLPIRLCGEMGADPRYTPLLLGLGIETFSVGFSSLPRLKARIRSLSLTEAREHARQVMNQYDPAVIHRLVEAFPRD